MEIIGNQIRIRNNNVTTLYAHCNDILVKEGDIVSSGQVIGTVGNTGRSTGPHLHLSILNGWAGIDYILWSNSYFNNNLNPITKINFPSGQYWNNRTTWYK